jgi:glycerol-3-phosphate dehydrogenase (NAD(P)+)
MDSGRTLSNPVEDAVPPIRRIHIVGAGAWGTTIAMLCARNSLDVTLVAHTPAAAAKLEHVRRRPQVDSGATLPAHVRIEHLDEHSIGTADAIVMAVPVQSMLDVLPRIARALAAKKILSAAKGIEVHSLLRPSEVIDGFLQGNCRLAVVSGPNLSAEIAAGKPASTVVASRDTQLARHLAATLHSDRFRTYLSEDVTGVEFGGALKNIIAIGAGIADGLQAGDNAKAALVTRGLAEIARLGVACGAEPLTFAGLSGMGDLIATCSSPLSRNHQVGAGLAQGRRLAEIQEAMVGTAEGVATTRAAVQLAARTGVDMPIASQMYRVLFDGVSPADAIARLMERDPGPEWR